MKNRNIFGISYNPMKLESKEIACQVKVHNSVQSVGGYWKPFSGLARLTEEVGELSAAIRDDDVLSIAEELADVWIISTCIANQYSVILRDERRRKRRYQEETQLSYLYYLYESTGELARLVNFYEGPKKPKPGEKIKTVSQIVEDIHDILQGLSSKKGISLYAQINKKLRTSSCRDRRRFGNQYDPSSSDAVEEFSAIIDNVACPFAKRAKVWGGISWNSELDLEGNIKLMLPDFLRFMKISRWEDLDAFVISSPKEFGTSIDRLSEFVRRTLVCISSNVQSEEKSSIEDVLRDGWHFTVNGEKLFISTFASCYDRRNSRYSYGSDHTFIVFQPEKSFKNYKFVKSGRRDFEKKRVRVSFFKKGQSYERDDILNGGEACRYVKPLSAEEPIVTWWKSKGKILLPGDEKKLEENSFSLIKVASASLRRVKEFLLRNPIFRIMLFSSLSFIVLFLLNKSLGCFMPIQHSDNTTFGQDSSCRLL